jgi:hypothetical protein
MASDGIKQVLTSFRRPGKRQVVGLTTMVAAMLSKSQVFPRQQQISMSF